MPDLDKELDEIIAQQKPGFRRVDSTAGPAAASADQSSTDTTAELVRKYLGGKRAAPLSDQGEEATEHNDLTIVHVRPERESDDPRQNVTKAVVVSLRRGRS